LGLAANSIDHVIFRIAFSHYGYGSENESEPGKKTKDLFDQEVKELSTLKEIPGKD
jgi:hypothetical protein